MEPKKCGICILWNIIDTFIYAIIPFVIILICSIIIIIKICQRRRSTMTFGGICHTNPRIIATQDHLSKLLIIINCLFLMMTGPFNICLIIQSILKHFFWKKYSMKIFLQLNQSLRLLENSYHAVSFIFYCLAGNKFRECALSMCQLIYCKLFKLIFGYQPRNYIPHKPTISTSSTEINKRTLNLIKKQSYVTSFPTTKRVKSLNTFV
jgi:hypothetical protein